MLADSLSSGERRTVGGERPHVIVVVDAETGQARTGSMIFLSMLEHPTLQSLFANEERSWPETSSAGFLAARTTQDGQTFTTSRTDVTAGPTNSAIWC